MNEHDEKILSPDEIAALMGAEKVECLSGVSMDPIGLMLLATRVAQRLTSKGGRPTDASWKISRKVPMKEETWRTLEEMSNDLAEHEVKVATGQLAAIALERGVSSLMQTKEITPQIFQDEFPCSPCSFPEEECAEARELVGAVNHERIW